MDKPLTPNSGERKPISLSPPKKKIAKIASGVPIKKEKGFLDKLSETFWGDDAGTVGHYVLFDVAIPAAKNMLYDMAMNGLERVLWGITGRRGNGVGRKVSNGMMVDYNSLSLTRPRERQEVRSVRARHEIELYSLPTRREAEDVLNALIEKIDQYDTATVADYYDAIGVASTYTDQNYGWNNLNSASVQRTRDGFEIELPRPLPLE